MAETGERVLVYDRIEANRRNTALLLGLLALASLPAAAYVAQYLAFLIAIIMLSAGWAAAIIIGALMAVGIVLAAAYLQYRYSAALVLRLSGAREVGRDEEPELQRIVENLCIGAGLPQPKVYMVESGAANAFATGLDPERASLVVTRGLLSLLDRRELEGVVAHELSHIGNYDTRLSTTLATGVGLLRLPLAIVLGFFRFLFRFHWVVGVGVLLYLGLPLLFGVAFSLSLLSSDPGVGVVVLLAMAVPVYAIVGAPLLGLLLRRSISRQREFLADADAVLLTRHAEGLATALAKISAASGTPVKAEGTTAHLYVADPIGGEAPWWDRIFSTHPPIRERIALLADMGDGIAPSVLRLAEQAGAEFKSAASQIPSGEAAGWEARPRADKVSVPVEVAAAEEPRRAPVAFRLTGDGAVLYERPDAASPQLARLEGGALVTALEAEGDFVRVLTVDDTFGYVSRSTPMVEVEVDLE
jgi:heat shock protein HtpX